MKAFKPEDFTALIAIDWADRKHDVCELNCQTKKQQLSVISSKSKAINEWANNLKLMYKGQLVAVACELKKGPSDDIVLTLHMDKLTVITPDSPTSQLVEYRRKLVQERVDSTNRITTTLKKYYPHVLDWFKEKDTVIFCDFISRWPSLKLVKKARKQTLIDFFNKHNARYNNMNEKRIQEIKDDESLTYDMAVILPNALMIECLIPQLKQLMLSIARFDSETKALYNKHADPRAVPQLAPRLLAAMGSNRNRYQSVEEMKNTQK